MATTNIINVNVNGMTATEAIDSVKSRMDSVQKSAFNIAVLAAYATGTTIPAFGDKGEATCEHPVKQRELLIRVNKAEATLSRWIKEVNLIIDAGDFAEYAGGLYPFQFDKVICLYETPDAFADMEKADFFKLSAVSIKEMAKAAQKAQAQEDSEEEDSEQETEDPQETQATEQAQETLATKVTFTYNGTEYSVSEQDMIAFLEKCEIVNK